MQLHFSTQRPRATAAGFALLIVLLFCGITLIILASTVTRSVSTARMNDRSNQFLVLTAAAEAATEKVIARLNDDYRNGGDNAIINNLSTYRTDVPTATESSYWTNFSFTDSQGNEGQTYVVLKSVTTSNWAALDFEYEGLSGYTSDYRIVSNVKSTNSLYPNMVGCIQQDVQTAEIPLFQFAIFYNSLLELVNNGYFTVNGPVHVNGDFYAGTFSPYYTIFNSAVSISGSISNVSYWAGTTNPSVKPTFNAYLKTNTTTINLPIGTNNTAAAVRELLYPPASTESITSPMGQQRFYNKAQLVILVSNTTAVAWVKNGLNDSTVTGINWTNLTTFVTTNTVGASFTDQREGKLIKATQFDIGKYTSWAKTNSLIKSELGTNISGEAYVPNIIYIGDFRTNSAATMSAVRLTNGLTLPNNNGGLTFATPQPLYVWGNYNCTNTTHFNTTNTSTAQPAAFFADAFTVLSTNWRDSYSTSNYTARVACNTTINAAVVAGVVFSTGPAFGQYSGGVNNFPRLLEYWRSGSSFTNTLNTSIVCLYNSVIATNIFIDPGDSSRSSSFYYYPPSRAYSFDSNFLTPSKQPPGTPRLRAMIRVNWSTPPPGTTNYVGL
ncbi:MAG: hypothetical protein RL380_236 [Verrucomicrobiota bacterium]